MILSGEIGSIGLISFVPVIKERPRMKFEGLSPEQKRLVFDLSKRIELLETHLKRLQISLVKIDRLLPKEIAKNMKDLNLN